MVLVADVGLGLDLAVHTSVYGKVPFLPQGWLLLSSTTRPLHTIARQISGDARRPTEITPIRRFQAGLVYEGTTYILPATISVQRRYLHLATSISQARSVYEGTT